MLWNELSCYQKYLLSFKKKQKNISISVVLVSSNGTLTSSEQYQTKILQIHLKNIKKFLISGSGLAWHKKI